MAQSIGFRMLVFTTGATCLAAVLAYGGRWVWACELLVNFRTHFTVLLSLSLVIALVLRSWRIAALAVMGLALNTWPLHDALFGPAPAPREGKPVRIVAFNVYIGNGDMRRVAAYLDSLAVDVAVLEELSTENASRLASLLPQLPHRYFAANDGVRNVAIYSRWPLIDPQPAIRDGVLFAARADVDLGDRRFRFYGAHLNWPVVPVAARGRNAQLRALGHELAACEHACVAVGDFNVTPWSSHFRGVLAIPGVQDCAAGQGLLTTWPSALPALFRIRIDQCLVAGEVGVAAVRVGDNVGSDHFATINDLTISGP